MSCGIRLWQSALIPLILAVLEFFPSRCLAAEAPRAYIQFNVSSHEEFNSAVNFAEDHGAFLNHRFYPYSAIGLVPDGAVATLETSAAVNHVYVGRVPEISIAAMETHEAYLAQAYNNLFFSSVDADLGTPPAEVMVLTDCRPIPRKYLDEICASSADAEPPPSVPPICEFMLGHVVVGMIMPESAPGVGAFDWTESEEQKTVEETISAMEWWMGHGPERSLCFSYDINYRVPVDVEPMAMGGDEVEDLWAGQSLEYLGYVGANHFDQCYKYIEGTREQYEADWGFVSFVLDGREDVSFGAYVAYSFIGGPFTVTINANGPIGPHNLDRIFGHVMGNTFYCLDEFGDSHFTCTDRSGYMNVENGNKLRGGNGCKISVPCIMRAAADPTVLQDLSPCYYTQGVVGWWDEDEDGIPDILDTNPVLRSVKVDTTGLSGVVKEDTLFARELSVTGTVAAVPIPNRNPYSLNSNVDFTVERVRAEFRVNEGSWMDCEPDDGRFDGPTEKFRFTAKNLMPGLANTVEVRGATAHGNVTPDSAAAAFEFYVVHSETGSGHLRILTSNPTRAPISIGFVPSHPSVAEGNLIAVEIAIYDAAGRKIRIVESGQFAAGKYDTVEWDGEDSSGIPVATGVYLVVMDCRGNREAEKVVVIP